MSTPIPMGFRRLMLWLAVAAAAAAGVSREAGGAREVAAKRECATCHITWITDFKRADETPLVPYEPMPVVDSGRQDAASTERMCFSCHDGFVRDSRSLWKNRGHSHPVGVRPSSRIKTPAIEGKPVFPLNEDGKVYCGTCHTAHSVAWGPGEKSVFLRARNTDSSLCIACHLDASTGPKEGHHPVFKTPREVAASLRDAGGRLGEGGIVICESCHRSHGAPEAGMLAVRNDRSQLCGACHADLDAKDRVGAARSGTHPVNFPLSGDGLADDLRARGGRLGHGGELVCQTCHKPHGGQPGAGILVMKNDDSALCQTCHGKERRIAGGKHDLAASAADRKNVRAQPAGRAGVCSACHLPHGGQGPKMWAREVAREEEPMAALCLSCHGQGESGSAKSVGPHSHPVGREMKKEVLPAGLPLFTREGIKAALPSQGTVTCATCHDPHQWDPADAGRVPAVKEEGNGLNSFLRKPNGRDMSLCRDCHEEKWDYRGTKHDMALAAPGDRNARGETAMEAGPCGPCHEVHNGKGPRMWAREPLRGVDPVSSTCLSCHNPEGVARKSLIGKHTHPVGVALGRTGNGLSSEGPAARAEKGAISPLPLHDAQGRPSRHGGNVTCGTCHDPHRWAPSPGTGGQVQKDPLEAKGDGRSSFLRMTADGEEGLCLACHGDKKAVASSRHDPAASGSSEKNARGQTAAESGLCGACHFAHNGRAARMWAREPGPGQGPLEGLCTGCHRAGGMAEGKIAGTKSHPMAADPGGLAGRASLPFYDAGGRRSRDGGRMECGTCHDPHRWDPASRGNAALVGKEVDGDARNSFLRLPAAPVPVLCNDCHKEKGWVRGTDHDLNVTGPRSVNGHGKTVEQSGVCGQCHAPHGALSLLSLWARIPGEGADGMEKLCRSCHDAGQAAGNKAPLKLRHPDTIKALRRDERVSRGGLLPLFSRDGSRNPAGLITCPTCHDPHRWSPFKEGEGPGRNDEGDARTSFLRGMSDFSICTDCHGLEGLFRYKYFHGETSRRKHPLYQR